MDPGSIGLMDQDVGVHFIEVYATPCTRPDAILTDSYTTSTRTYADDTCSFRIQILSPYDGADREDQEHPF